MKRMDRYYTEPQSPGLTLYLCVSVCVPEYAGVKVYACLCFGLCKLRNHNL